MAMFSIRSRRRSRSRSSARNAARRTAASAPFSSRPRFLASCSAVENSSAETDSELRSRRWATYCRPSPSARLITSASSTEPAEAEPAEDEPPHHDVRHQRPHRRKQRFGLVRAGPQALLPGGVVPVHLLAHRPPVLLAVSEVELEFQQVAQPGDLRPEG